MNDIRKKLYFCILGNGISLIIVLSLILSTKADGTYWNIGPNDNLIIVSVLINSWLKYTLLLFVITTINVIKVWSEDIGMPILGFNIYNPDKKLITDFGRLELQFMANLMFMIGSVRELFLILVTISQVDVALFDVVVKNITSFYTIRMLLFEKEFILSDIDLERGIIN